MLRTQDKAMESLEKQKMEAPHQEWLLARSWWINGKTTRIHDLTYWKVWCPEAVKRIVWPNQRDYFMWQRKKPHIRKLCHRISAFWLRLSVENLVQYPSLKANLIQSDERTDKRVTTSVQEKHLNYLNGFCETLASELNKIKQKLA